MTIGIAACRPNAGLAFCCSSRAVERVSVAASVGSRPLPRSRPTASYCVTKPSGEARLRSSSRARSPVLNRPRCRRRHIGCRHLQRAKAARARKAAGRRSRGWPRHRPLQLAIQEAAQAGTCRQVTVAVAGSRCAARVGGHCEVKNGAPGQVGSHPQPAPMSFDDRTADR
jgi:hypothetical protein